MTLTLNIFFVLDPFTNIGSLKFKIIRECLSQFNRNILIHKIESWRDPKNRKSISISFEAD